MRCKIAQKARGRKSYLKNRILVADLPEAERLKRNKKNNMYAIKRVANETQEEKDAKNLNQRERYAKRPPIRRVERTQQTREYRANESPEQHEDRLSRNRAYARKIRANETQEDRDARNLKNREARANLPAEKRIELQDRANERQTITRSKYTKERKKEMALKAGEIQALNYHDETKECFTDRTKAKTAFRAVYRRYQSQAKARNYDFGLNEDEFYTKVKENCEYCGVEPRQISKSGSRTPNFVYNGIDRVDNGIGYTVDNCVPCCKICNNAKRNLTQEEWEEWLDRIGYYRRKKSTERLIQQIKET